MNESINKSINQQICKQLAQVQQYLQLLVAGCGVSTLSVPGKALANFLNNALILKPAFALLSINIIPSFEDRSSPSSTDTCRLSDKSVLLPTRTMITSFPLSFLTSSIHFDVLRNDARSTVKEKELEIGTDN